MEVFGEVDEATEVGGGGQAKNELWYARVVGYEGDSTVPNNRSLNVDDYGEDAIAVTVVWFHQAKEALARLTAQPKSDVVDHMIAALAEDEHLAGIAEDTIAWGAISSTAPTFLPLLAADVCL